MFNVAVLKMRDIIKFMIGVLITIFVIMYISKYFPSTKSKEKQERKQSKIDIFQFGSLTSCLDKTIPTMASINDEYKKMDNENDEIMSKNYLEQFLKTELSTIKGIEKIEKNVAKNNDNQQKKEEAKAEDDNQLSLASKNSVQTEVVTPNPITESFNVKYGNVKIKNQTTYSLTEDVLKPDIKIDNKNVLIFHTHSCESYTSSEKYPYNATGNFRTTDLNYTVTRVGTELENYLKQYNVNVAHDMSYHDYPAYNGSYTRSLATVENMLKSNPSDIVIDLHRDAIGSRPDYAPTVKIGEDYAAQIMFVIRN